MTGTRTSLIALFAFLTSLSFACGAPTSTAQGAVSCDSAKAVTWLKRQGNKICWKGKDVGRLVGVNIEVYPHGMKTLANKKQTLDTIRSLGANLVRINIHPGEWRDLRGASLNELSAMADHALSKGMFVIIDYHAIGMPDRYHPMPGWDRTHRPIYDSKFELARSFWREIARRFKNRGGVVFELWNEPADPKRGSFDVQWAKFAPKWQNLINIIRQEGARNLILAAGDHWARNLINYDRMPLSDPQDNFSFAYHDYHNLEPQNAGKFVGHMVDRFPILGTEWGMPDNLRKPTRQEFINYEREFLDKKFRGWTAWSWSTAADPNLLVRYFPVGYTNWGLYLKTKMGRQTVAARP